MKTVKQIDYHIELSSTREFTNELIKNNIIPIDGKTILNDLKKVVINANMKPFFSKNQTSNTDSSYYEKYVRFEADFNEKTIPDFFIHNEDIYDLEEPCIVRRNMIEENVFQRLFVIKLLEIVQAKGNINQFLDLQLYDNFYGDKEEFGQSLLSMLSKDSNCYLSPAIASEIQQWIKRNNLSDLHKMLGSIPEDQLIEDNETNYVQLEQRLKYKKDIEIKGLMSLEEIKHYFSFLYKEVIDRNKPTMCGPFLTEEAVKQIFANGLIIPAIPLEEKFKLKTELRFPKKIVDFAIHKFMALHSITKRDKADYLLFFGSYLEDYQDALSSTESLKTMGSNISGRRSSRDKIKWEKYIPAKRDDLEF